MDDALKTRDRKSNIYAVSLNICTPLATDLNQKASKKG